MMPILYLMIGLVAGAVLTYALTGVTRARYIPLDTFTLLKDKLAQAEKELASQSQEILGLTNQLTAMEQNEKHLEEKITGFKEELQRMHELSHEQFRNIASRILEDRQTAFVATNKKELNEILSPFREGLMEFRKKVEDTRKEDIADLTSLKKEIEGLEKLNARLSEDASFPVRSACPVASAKNILFFRVTFTPSPSYIYKSLAQ